MSPPGGEGEVDFPKLPAGAWALAKPGEGGTAIAAEAREAAAGQAEPLISDHGLAAR